MRVIAVALLALLLSCAFPVQACAPAEVNGGTGTTIHVGSKGGGVFAFTFCAGDYAVRPLYLYAPWSALTPEVLADIQAARESVAAFAAQVNKVTGRQCVIEAKELMVEAEAVPTHWELCSKMHDDMLAHWPPEPVWAVVPSATGSRPMYRVVAGVRQSSAVYGERAPNGARCSCSQATALPAGTEATRWCPVVDRPADLVTLCGRGQ
jgi:hypothetical protein